MKSNGLTIKLLGKLIVWSEGEADGIGGVGVKSVDITKNTHCEGDLLELN
ncbi:hypothetical protein cco71_09103 [Campylobacter coli 317/04]|nr:hypothetical protein cco71_09103 [Campylobacter coli 317/04]